MDLLEPGCEGVIKNIDSVPLKNFKEAFEYIVDMGNRYYEEMQGEWEEDYSDPHRGNLMAMVKNGMQAERMIT